tara:strand:+ start:176 stop:625 length:450 start_codon:yes stop_codon:yes gene_type:complete
MAYEKKYTITSDMIAQFGESTGDKNPLHFDEDFAATTRFKGKIVHGMLIGGLIGDCLTEYYGAGTIYVEQFLKFKAPVRENDVVKIRLHHQEYLKRWNFRCFPRRHRPNPYNRIKLHILATVDDKTVIEGETVIIAGNNEGFMSFTYQK